MLSHNFFTKRPGRRLSVLAPLLLLCLLAVAVRPAEADAARQMKFGLFDNLYLEEFQRNVWLKRTRVDARAETVRIPARWKFIAPDRPADPTNPNAPAYEFQRLDGAVREATNRGLNVVLNLTTAPAWAEGPGRSGKITEEGAWDPDPVAFGNFAKAVARRYSGTVGTLPRVRFYEAWNEPNYGLNHLAPQWKDRKPYGVTLYRRLLNAMYDSVNSVKSSNKVVGPSLGPFGRAPNGRRGPRNELAGTRPLWFLRELLCLRHNARMTPTKCPRAKRARFDVLSHHPINPAGSPAGEAAHPDSVVGGDLGQLNKVMRKAEKAGNVVPARIRRPLWVTEFWWTTNPPDAGGYGVRPMKQARNIEEALYVFWRAGVERAYGFMIRDTRSNPTGLYTQTGQPKPSLTAFRFPLVADRRSKRQVLVWGRSPADGRLKIEKRKPGGWKTLARTSVKSDKIFTETLRFRGKAKLRARIGAERSLAWRVKAE